MKHFPFLLLVPFFSACLFDAGHECELSTDCAGELFCRMGRCTDLRRGPGGQAGYLFEADLDAGLSPDAESAPHPCPDALPASETNLVLNEILAYVPTGPEGDANGDGVRHAHDDEFVELVNVSNSTVDMTDVAIFNDTTQRFRFEPFCLEPLHAVVVFGGIEPGAALPEGEGWTSFVADSRFAYANGAGRAVVKAADGTTIADFSYGAHPAQSLNLETDLTGHNYVPHAELNEEAIFSPGTCADGRPFTTGCVAGP